MTGSQPVPRVSDERLAQLNDYGWPTNHEMSAEMMMCSLDLRDARAAARELSTKYERLRKAVNESVNDCNAECDSHGHRDDCKTYDAAAWIVDLQAERDSLRERAEKAEAERDEAIGQCSWAAGEILNGRRPNEVMELLFDFVKESKWIERMEADAVEWDKAESEVAALKLRLEQAREALRFMLDCSCDSQGATICPACHRNESSQGHADDCIVARALAAGEPTP